VGVRVFRKNMATEYHKNKPQARGFLKSRHYRKILKFFSLQEKGLQNRYPQKTPFLVVFLG